MTHPLRHIKRFRMACTLAPPVVAGAVGGVTLAVAEWGYGNGFVGWGGLGLYALLSSRAMAGVVLVVRHIGARRPVYAAFWSAVGGTLLAAPMIVFAGMVDLHSDAQAGIALVVGPFYAGFLGVAGALLGWAMAGLPLLRFTTRAEREVQDACRECGYSLEGIDARVCPECGSEADGVQEEDREVGERRA